MVYEFVDNQRNLNFNSQVQAYDPWKLKDSLKISFGLKPQEKKKATKSIT